MRILITGASGQLAREFQRVLCMVFGVLGYHGSNRFWRATDV